jgi:hypothetical protein
LVGSGKRYANQLSLATYPPAIALAQFPTVALKKVGLRRFAVVRKLAYHRAGVDGQGRIVTLLHHKPVTMHADFNNVEALVPSALS